ncbi:hypothetical protein MFLO_01565 [Listeria floridensis FSL S10-1187]|uniref:XRE family transcriptional regulator n=1 Tax=Listeria floridensis FSL S10-1187 TaxID=1265817 RepID=A0ABN0RJ15_9LIST|nr:HTH domain-containing protein [Listeria floridensis]EUJ33871.1 hypothetical protein MFLO_01565 [Listeria floridensis FSL S10-1187]
MKFASLKKNSKELKEKYLFTDELFQIYFQLNYQELQELEDTNDVRYQRAIQTSVFLTEPFRDLNTNQRLKELIETLRSIGKFPLNVLAAYAKIDENELRDYCEGKSDLTDKQKFDACSRLSLLDRFAIKGPLG